MGERGIEDRQTGEHTRNLQFNYVPTSSLTSLLCLSPDIICKIPHTVPISAHHKWNYDSLLEKMWDYLKLVRIYTKPKGQVSDWV